MRRTSPERPSARGAASGGGPRVSTGALAEHRRGRLEAGVVPREVGILYRGGASGVLEIDTPGGVRRLFFEEGDLYLPPAHPLAGPLARSLNGEDGAAAGLMERMAGVLASWNEGSYHFAPGRAAVPPGAVGPLPTAEMVLVLAVLGRDEAGIVEELGGESAYLVRREPAEGRPEPERELLRPEDLECLDRLREPQRLQSLLAGNADGMRQVLHSLARLSSLGLLERTEVEEIDEVHVTPSVIQPFLERVAGDLADRPLDLAAEDHRAFLAGLLGSLGDRSYYEILEVPTDASMDEVHDGYNHLARRVHPSHAARLRLGGREGALGLLFERATEAYMVLSDPDRRVRYNTEMGIVPQYRSRVIPVAGKNREQDAARGADLFAQAQGMVEREEYHYAVEVLRQSLTLSPSAEAYALLAEVQRKNPQWLHQAAESYRRAVRLAPNEVEYRVGLAEIYEQADQRERALAAYRSILTHRPSHTAALEGVSRLQGKRRTAEVSVEPADGAEAKRRGFFSRMFRRG